MGGVKGNFPGTVCFLLRKTLFELIYNLRLTYDFFFKLLQKQYYGVPEKRK